MYKKMELCAARHTTPATDGAVFPTELNPLDLQGIAEQAAAALAGVKKLDLYVTGLTVALVEVLKYCTSTGIELTLFHFDRESGEYYPQSF